MVLSHGYEILENRRASHPTGWSSWRNMILTWFTLKVNYILMPTHYPAYLMAMSVISSVVCLPTYILQDIRDCQLEDSLIGPLLKNKEANKKPQSIAGDPELV